jgi:hypothetical protein
MSLDAEESTQSEKGSYLRTARGREIKATYAEDEPKEEPQGMSRKKDDWDSGEKKYTTRDRRRIRKLIDKMPPGLREDFAIHFTPPEQEILLVDSTECDYHIAFAGPKVLVEMERYVNMFSIPDWKLKPLTYITLEGLEYDDENARYYYDNER